MVTSATSRCSACTRRWSVRWRAVGHVRCVKTGSGPLLDCIGRWAQALDASGSCWIDRWSLNEQGHVAATGALDAAGCVRCMGVRASGALVICPTTLFEGVSLYIYMLAGHGSFSLGIFDILVTLLSWANSHTHIPTHLLAFDCDSWVRLSDSSALIIALHLEALGGLFWLLLQVFLLLSVVVAT
jgi:hypothetical protein